MYFKQCPFCEKVFDIGATDHRLMEVHIVENHRDENDGGATRQQRSRARLRTIV